MKISEQEERIERIESLLVAAIQKGHSLKDLDSEEVDTMFGVDPAIRLLISAAADETLRRIRLALHRISNFDHRSDREKELLMDLVEALGGKVAG